MKPPTDVLASRTTGDSRLRIAAAGDVHCGEHNRDEVATAFQAIDGTVDLILLAGDLTTHGEPEQAAILAEVCRGLETPVIAVLGNHDLHVNRGEEVVSVLEEAGVEMLDRSHTIHSVGSSEVGIAGSKGFVGGFKGMGLPDFGEPSLRGVYREGQEEVDAVAEGLRAIAHCPFRIVLLHYAPTHETLVGEPVEIWAFLGTDRLGAPVREHRPDLVLHGHAHAGTFEGRIGQTPVYNVAVHVTGRDFYVFDLDVVAPGHTAVGVESTPPDLS